MCQLTSPEGLRRLLARCGISQRQAATACAVSPATINILLRKGQTPKTTWPRLREALTGPFAGCRGLGTGHGQRPG